MLFVGFDLIDWEGYKLQSTFEASPARRLGSFCKAILPYEFTAPSWQQLFKLNLRQQHSIWCIILPPFQYISTRKTVRMYSDSDATATGAKDTLIIIFDYIP